MKRKYYLGSYSAPEQAQVAGCESFLTFNGRMQSLLFTDCFPIDCSSFPFFLLVLGKKNHGNTTSALQ